MNRNVALAIVAALAVLALALDQVVEARLQDLIADRVSAQIGADVDVDVAGSPLLLTDVVRSRVSRVEVSSGPFRVGDPEVEVASLRLELVDVRASIPGLIGGSETSLRVGGGDLLLTLAEPEVQRLLAREGVAWDVEVGAAAISATGTFEGAEVRVTADALIDGDDLLLLARDVDPGALGPAAVEAVAAAFATRVALPTLPLGLRLTEVAAVDGVVHLTGPVPATLGLG